MLNEGFDSGEAVGFSGDFDGYVYINLGVFAAWRLCVKQFLAYLR